MYILKTTAINRMQFHIYEKHVLTDGLVSIRNVPQNNETIHN